MADKSLPVIMEALSRAAAEPAGQPLHGTKAAPGLFAATAPARQAAERCKTEGYLQVLRTEHKGKSVQEICTITEKGIAYLLGQVSPKQVLEQFVQVVEARGRQIGDLLSTAQQWQTTFAALRARVEKVLANLQQSTPSPASPSANGTGPWKTEALAFLSQWQALKPNEDCPLPELYRRTKPTAPALTIGQFHDGVRSLHDQGQIYLHPWTGPLYEIPEPACALLVGHTVAYYVSRKER